MGVAKETARTRAEIIPPDASISAQKFRVLMKDSREGVPKGGRENYLERQSRGRGLCIRRLLPFGGLQKHSTTAVPATLFFQTPIKLRLLSYSSFETVNTWAQGLSTGENTPDTTRL